MSDTARATETDDSSASSALVPAVGTVLSVVSAAALAAPVRRGVDDPGLWLATGLAVVATLAFLARRHELLERRVTAPVAAGASLLVVVLSGYVIATGVLASAVVPGLEWSISLLFLSFFTAAGTVGVGVADYVGVSGLGLLQRTGQTVEMLILAFVSLISLGFVEVFLEAPVVLALGEPTPIQEQVIYYLSFAVAFGAVSVGYLRLRGRDLSFIDLERPSIWTVGWLVGGIVLLLGMNVGYSALMDIAGVEGADHTVFEDIADNPDLLYVIVPASILIVGPFEELLFRNVVQKSMYGRFSRYGAVVVASVVFTAVHIAAYATAGANQILASLSMLFVLSLILGTIYERTENLLVPALIHGCYNATVFLVAV